MVNTGFSGLAFTTPYSSLSISIRKRPGPSGSGASGMVIRVMGFIELAVSYNNQLSRSLKDMICLLSSTAFLYLAPYV